ncbi:MAG: hypothetical protein M1826_003726 [Phylliscum demangeonii]|nr:MAG: hypothetical protein M1826_003726 [Phylliscum demangeonii]
MFLPSAVASGGYFPTADDLGAICTSGCLQSLEAVRQLQASVCASDQVQYGGASVRPTVQLDAFIWTYNHTCRRDAATGAFCEPIFDEWASATAPPNNTTCSDCVLGVLQTQLNSYFGYDAAWAKNLSSMTSSCHATGYPVTSPAPYGHPTDSVSTTPTSSTSTSSPSCAATYPAQAGDDCHSISLAHKVSTAALLVTNALEAYCYNFPKAGTKLCLPASCDVYTVQANDTCFAITQAHKNAFTTSQLLSWNVDINRACSNMGQLVGQQICIRDRAAAASSNSNSLCSGKQG